MFQTQAKVGRRTVLMGMFGTAAGIALVACGGKNTNSAQSVAPATTSQTQTTATAPIQAAQSNSGSKGGKAPLAKTLLSKEEIETVLGRPVGDLHEINEPNGSLASYYPISVEIQRGGNTAFQLTSHKDLYKLTEAAPEFGNNAFASASDILVVNGDTLLYIGCAGVRHDDITLDMMRALMRKALSRV